MANLLTAVYDGHIALLGAPWNRDAHPIKPDPEDFASLADVYRWCEALGVTQVWLMGPTRNTADPRWWEIPRPLGGHAAGPNNTLVSACVKPSYRATSGAIYVHDLTYNDEGVRRDARWPWSGEMAPAVVLAAVLETSAALDWPLSYSPAHTGTALLQRLLVGHRDWFTYPQEAIDKAITHPNPGWLDNSAAAALLGYGDRWLHVYDKNASHLAAASRVALGAGNFSAGITDWHNPRSHGIYLAEYPAGRVLPGRRGWFDRAALSAAVAQGQAVDVIAGYRFSEAHAAMRTWADRVWAARLATGGLARACIKACYVGTIGTLNRRGTSGYRPLWHAAIVAEAVRHSWAQVTRLTTSTEQPIAMWVDSIRSLSTSEQPGAGVPPKGVPAALGGLRHVGTYRVTDELGAVLRGGTADDLNKWIVAKEGG